MLLLLVLKFRNKNSAIPKLRLIGISSTVLEGDSMVIIKALDDEHNPLSPIGPLIADVKFNSRCFNHLLYSHTKRECNSVAHGLARFTVNI